MDTTRFGFNKKVMGILVISIVAVSFLIASCIPGGSNNATSSLPYIQLITAQLMPASSASPTASASISPTTTISISPLASAPVTAGPSSSPSGNTSPSATTSPAATANPTASTSPTSGAALDVMVSVQVTNFNIVNKMGQSAAQGEGHINFFLDMVPPIFQGVPASGNPGASVEIAGTSYLWPGNMVKPGLHILSAELVNNDRTPLSTPVVASVMVWIPDSANATSPNISRITAQILPANASPAVTPNPALTTSPASSPTVTTTTTPVNSPNIFGSTSPAIPSASAASSVLPTGSPAVTASPTSGAADLMVSIQPANFTVVPNFGQTPVSRQGHIHFFLDSIPPTFPGQISVPANGTWTQTANTSWTFPGIMPGVHVLIAELVNNDHTALNPPVVASVVLTILPSGTAASPTGSASPASTSIPSVTTSPSVSASPTATASPSTSVPTATSGGTATINLVAQNFAFNMSTITATPGAQITVNFNNMDSGIPHNFSVYTDSSATTKIFTGQVITGPATTTYTFTAPTAPGNYFLRCDIHPTIMTGQFVVK